MVKLDPSKKIMLIDTSYYIFYRYFAVFNWYKMSQKIELDVGTLLTNEEFMGKFDKLFEVNLNKLCKLHNVSYENTVFVRDCIRDRIWRYDHFPDYKMSRDDKSRTFNGDIFKYVYNTLLTRLSQKLGVQSCEHCKAEADDIIAVFTRDIGEKYPDAEIAIITNDNDYIQLIGSNVGVYNLKNYNLSERLGVTHPDTYLTQKIIMGDKSDNIPPIFNKCGEKKAKLLAENPEMLQAKLAKHPDSAERFELNRLLIDTKCIPNEIKGEIMGLLELS